MKLLTILFILLTLNSCAALYGIKEADYAKETINAFLKKQHYDVSIIMNDSLYTVFYYELEPNFDSLCSKNLFQPLQVHYIDQRLENKASLVNCYAAPGLTSLNWNKKKKMESFPPKSDFDVNVCNSAILKLIEQYPLNKEEAYYVVVFWNLYMERQSEILIKEVEKNIKDQKCKVILINNDIWFKPK